MESSKLRLAILDMNNGHPNQGMRCIREIAAGFSEFLEIEEFDVRVTNEVPDLSFDIYLSSGGPGNPLEGNGIWERRFTDLIDRIWAFNKLVSHRKKYFFFICHSFQLVCKHFELGEITKRRSTSFGIYPVHKTRSGKKDPILQGLPDPHYVVDSRDWQLIQPRLGRISKKGAKILSLEKIRTHVEYERAIMAVRFSPEMIGTQYHPEADPQGMMEHFKKEENKEKVITNFGEKKYQNMMAHLEDPDKIMLTHGHILPNFFKQAISNLTPHTFQTA